MATYNGTAGNDNLNGGSANDQLFGFGGNDTLNGGNGNDTMTGGTGNDTYVVGSSSDKVVELSNEGIDTVQSSVSWTLATGNNVENLTLTGNSALNGTGNELDNILTGNGGANTLTGNAGNDSLYGGAGNDTLNGGTGNDLLDGGTGNDTMTGGTGDDIYVVGSNSDKVVELANEGIDTVQSSVSWTLATGNNVENLTLTGTSALNGTGNELDNILTGNAGANTLTGNAGNDSLYGGAGNDSLDGGTGNDSLDGGTGNDLLDGGTGNDTMIGGAGNDTYIVDSINDIVVESATSGIDTVKASISQTLLDNFENLDLTGGNDINGRGNAADNTLNGNGGSNTLSGGAGNDVMNGHGGDDTLDGEVGADVMAGGVGNDVYVVDNAGDVVIEQTSEGTDTILSGVSYTLGDGVENLTLTGSNNIDAAGNGQANALTGNAGNNALFGLDGDDTLTGGAGDDLLIGGSGNDVYLFSSGFGSDVVINDDSEGSDTIRFTDVQLLDVTPTRSGLDLVLAAGTDSITVRDWFNGDSHRVEQIEFADGSSWSAADIRRLTNIAPIAVEALADQLAEEDSPFQFVLPDTAFADPDSSFGDSLTFSAALADGSPLPAWLTFDPLSRSFSGTPDQNAAGVLVVSVTAVDATGAAASSTFNLTVADNTPSVVVRTGGEFRVNTETTGAQGYASVAALADGGFIVAYESDYIDGYYDIMAQRYAADGSKVGAEFMVNTTTPRSQYEPSVAGTTDGGFVVAWQSSQLKADGDIEYAIRLQRYAADGVPLGGEATAGIGDFTDVAVTALNDGGHVVTWGDWGWDEGYPGGVYARRYDAAGAATGEVFEVIAPNTGYQGAAPEIAALSDGGFVVTWIANVDGTGNRVWAQRFDAAGAKSGEAFGVDATASGWQMEVAAVTSLSDGGFVLAWSDSNTWVQSFGADGIAMGDAVQVDAGEGYSYRPDVVGLPDGGFVVTWQADFGDNDNDIFARRFGGDGLPAGDVFLVNSFAPGYQGRTSVTTLGDGGYVITWHSRDQDGDDRGVYGQRYDAAGNALGNTLTYTGTDQGETIDVSGSTEPVMVFGLDGDDALTGGTGADAVAGGDGNDTLTGGAGDDLLIGGSGNDVYLFSSGFGRDVVINDDWDGSDTIRFTDLQLTDVTATRSGPDLVLSAGSDCITVRNWFYGDSHQVEQIEFADGSSWSTDDIRLLTNTAPVVGGGLADQATTEGSPFQYVLPDDAFVDPDVDFDDSLTFSATLADGSPLPAWLSFDPWSRTFSGTPGDDAAGVVALSVTATDNQGASASTSFNLSIGEGPTVRMTGEFQVNTRTTFDQGHAMVAALADGGYIVAYESDDDNRKYDILAQRYAADGTKVGEEFQVNATDPNNQWEPAVVGLTNGGFAIAWQSSTFDPDYFHYALHVQAFDAAGAPVGVEQVIAANTNEPALTALDDGGFVVAWKEYDESGIFMQRCDFAGVPQGPAFAVDPDVDSNQYIPGITTLSDGSFVVAWAGNYAGSDVSNGYLQRFDASGASLGERLSFGSAGYEAQSAVVSALPDGGFVLAWRAGWEGLRLQRFDSTGTATGTEQLLTGDHSGVRIAGLPDGGFVVVWSQYESAEDESGSGIYAQRFGADSSPAGETFLVNTFTEGYQGTPSVAVLPDGSFVVTWHSDQDGSEGGVYGQRYDANGNAIGDTPVYTGSAGDDTINISGLNGPAMVFGREGNDVLSGGQGNDVIEGGDGADTLVGAAGTDILIGGFGNDRYEFSWGSGSDLIMDEDWNENQDVIRFTDRPADAVTPTRVGRDLVLSAGDDKVTVFRWFDDSSRHIERIEFADGSAWSAEEIRLATNFAPTISVALADQVAQEGSSFQYALPYDAFFDPDVNSLNDTLTYSATLADGSPLPAWLSFDPWSRTFSGTPEMGAAGVVGLSVIATDAAGASASSRFNLTIDGTMGETSPTGGEFSVSSTSEAQGLSTGALVGGGFVAAYIDLDDSAKIVAQRYGADGAKQGAEIRVDEVPAGATEQPRVTGLADGGFLVSWLTLESRFTIHAQRFDAQGVASGEALVLASDVLTKAEFAALDDGGFVVTWSGFDQSVSAFRTYVQHYDASGVAQAAALEVATALYETSIAPLTDGGFVVVWGGGEDDYFYGQRFDSSATAIGGQFQIEPMPTADGWQPYPAVTAMADGGFVVSWGVTYWNGSDMHQDLSWQKFDANGLGGEVQLNVIHDLFNPRIAGLPDGGFVVVGSSAEEDGEKYEWEVFAKRFAADGQPVGDRFLVNSYTPGDQSSEVLVTGLADGGFIVTWRSSDGQDGTHSGYFAQRYDASGNAIGGDTQVINGTASGDGIDVSNLPTPVMLYGHAGDDVLTGGQGDDVIDGGLGADTLDGGVGDDVLVGDAGDDTYLFGRGSGADRVSDQAYSQNSDQAIFGAGIAADQLWFRRVDDSLEVSVIGTSDTLTVQDWYWPWSHNHVEQFKTADNQVLLDTQVENLVQAMAAFAPPPAGQTTLPPDYEAALAPVIAVNWQ